MSGHAHVHPVPTGPGTRRRLAVVLAVTLAVVVVQVVGGVLSGSLALLAEAGHAATDAAGLALVLLAAVVSARPASTRRTYGWQRAEVLAAAANAGALLAVGAVVLVTAARRLADPPPVQSGTMLAVALLGLVTGGVCLLVLRGGGDGLPLRTASLEVLADLLGSLAVVVAALVVRLTGSPLADPVVGVLIGLAVLPRAWHLLREALDVLLEAAPRGVDLAAVRAHLLSAPGVLDVHDLHAWTITSGVPVLSAHVVVDEQVLADGHGGALLDRLLGCLDGHFDVAHSTLQLEGRGHRDHEPVLHA